MKLLNRGPLSASPQHITLAKVTKPRCAKWQTCNMQSIRPSELPVRRSITNCPYDLGFSLFLSFSSSSDNHFYFRKTRSIPREITVYSLLSWSLKASWWTDTALVLDNIYMERYCKYWPVISSSFFETNACVIRVCQTEKSQVSLLKTLNVFGFPGGNGK